MATNQKLDKVETMIDLDDETQEVVDLHVDREVQKPQNEEETLDSLEFDLSDLVIQEPSVEEVQKDEENEEEDEEEDTLGETEDENQEIEPQGKEPQEKQTPSKSKKSRSQERIQQLVNEKKQAEQERLRAEAITAKLVEHIQSLTKEQQETSAKQVETEVTLWENKVKKAKEDYAKALDEGDTAKIAETQATLNDAQFTHRIVSAKKSSTTVSKPEDVVQEIVQKVINEVPSVQRVQTEQKTDTLAHKWVVRNSFIMQREDVRNAAIALYDGLQQEGYDENSPSIFEEAEARLGIIFPELNTWFERTKPKKTPEEQPKTQMTTPQNKPKTPPSAAPSRQTSPQQRDYQVKNGKVVINPTEQDRQTARQLGLDLKEYLKEKIKYQQTLDRGSRSTAIFD